MRNKPRGVVTTASDERGRDTVYQSLDQQLPWVAPVGRLDKTSEGLLLLTNDSEWSARILAPETHLEKIYHIQIATIADTALIRREDESDRLRAKSAAFFMAAIRGSRSFWTKERTATSGGYLPR
jgi:23S rRNA pseudouridine2605 synthase